MNYNIVDGSNVAFFLAVEEQRICNSRRNNRLMNNIILFKTFMVIY